MGSLLQVHFDHTYPARRAARSALAVWSEARAEFVDFYQDRWEGAIQAPSEFELEGRWRSAAAAAARVAAKEVAFWRLLLNDADPPEVAVFSGRLKAAEAEVSRLIAEAGDLVV